MSGTYSEHMSDNYIEGGVYAITGGASGFGRETALEVLRMGGKAAIMDNNGEKLRETVRLAEEEGFEGNLIAFEGDVSHYDENLEFINQIIEKYGRIDAFFANAGIMPNACYKDHEIALEHWDRCIDTNLKGVLYGISAVYDQFKKQGYGHFLATSSIHGNFPTGGAGVYSATKIAIRYFLHSLAVENHGMIKTTVINPPGVRTTGLFDTVVSDEGTDGIFGTNLPLMREKIVKLKTGEDRSFMDINSIHYMMPNTDDMVRSIMYALNQPKGVSISDVTMYAANNHFII